jgi:starch synthase
MPDPASTFRPRTPPEPLSIVMVTPECHPFARSGGLAEVCAALPRALAGLGHDVTVVLPRFRGIATEGSEARRLRFDVGSARLQIVAWERRLADGVLMAFVDVPELFDRAGLYGNGQGDYPDNAWRFGVFTRAALEYVRARGTRPGVFHAHDWQSGLLGVWQKHALAADPIVGGVPVVFTIHNLAFQGIFPAGTTGLLGLPRAVMGVEAMEYWGRISYLKAGINYSEKVSTVSPTYAREILTTELGCGMDGVLRRRAGDFVGILNGIDEARWTPAGDPFVPVSYGPDSLELKRHAKRALLQAAGLPATDAALARPVVGLLSRMTDQKGFDLLAEAAGELMRLEASWVLLGSGDPVHERTWQDLAATHPGRVAAIIGFEERLAHLIGAGADLFLMPSRFEPCGLNQLHSLRYGTVPVVRATGGLADTVREAQEDGTGFVFSQYAVGPLVSAMQRALAAFADEKAWRRLQRRGMRQDHSWDVSAREYVKVYGTAPK